MSDTADNKTDSDSANAPRRHGVKLTIERESRFAVVMYGGVSLAIYINGVTQELLNLVRATAPETSDDNSPAMLDATVEALTGAMSVYRKLGQYLLDRDYKHRAESLMRTEPTPDDIRTRFVVDVISGTSAGGINGMFLAKALARNQGMDGLKDLWLTEGDLGKLLNDKFSVKDLKNFKLNKPQTSLLNSQRMYRKLLEALANMDRPVPPNIPPSKYSQLVRELDLFITTTDIDGVPLPISLADEVVYERRYKNVFHFRYSTEDATGIDRDDFIKDNDPFLAFAARCTSSFPFAFEAMRLSDITNIADGFPPYEDKSVSTDDWDKFFSDYLRYGLFDLQREAVGQGAIGHLPIGITPDGAEKQLRSSFRDRSFGDGGYLDNKPFSYATAMLSRRFADTAVSRMLLYVEPTPEHPELDAPNPERPDFAENVQAAVLDLPRQETIREDLDRLYERNETIERVTMLAKEVDSDIEAAKRKPKADFDIVGLREMIRDYGVNYGAYHRLKVSESTNVLSEMIARAAGHDPVSDAGDAIRELVKAWRREEYYPEVAEAKAHNKKTENQFLQEFDLSYDIRRLAFLNRHINELTTLDEDAERLLEAVREHERRQWPRKLSVQKLIDDHGPEFQQRLNDLKKEKVAPALKEARSAEEKLRSREAGPGAQLYNAIGELKIGWPDLEDILQCDPGAARSQKAKQILSDEGRHAILGRLAAIISSVLSHDEPVEIQTTQTSIGAKLADLCLRHYYTRFLYYDLVTYPVQYGTGAGESNVVEVFRVSPEDAKNIVNERGSDSQATKLAGRVMMSFGAFFDETWRRNDMLWGRLDGAERLISALLQENDDDTKKAREFLINEAHVGILNQEIAEGNADAVCRLLSHALKHSKATEPFGQNVRKIVSDVRSCNSGRLNDAQKTALDTPQTFDRQLDPQRSLEYISRSTNITGDMLDGLADHYQITPAKRFARWMALAGSALWNLISVAVPESLGSLFFRHWLRLLYFVAVVLILLGLISPGIKFTGWEFLAVVIALHSIVTLLRAFMQGKLTTRKLKAGVLAAAVFFPTALLTLGVIHLIDISFHLSLKTWLELSITGVVALVVSLLLFYRYNTEAPTSADSEVKPPPPHAPLPEAKASNPVNEG